MAGVIAVAGVALKHYANISNIASLPFCLFGVAKIHSGWCKSQELSLHLQVGIWVVIKGLDHLLYYSVDVVT